jgi:subtilisin family serine protease
MKKSLFIISLLCLSLNLSSQNSLSKEQKLLHERVLASHTSNKAQIENYLSRNSNTKRVFKDRDGKTFVLYKIIDGKPIYRTTDNDKAAIATKTNELHTGGSLGLNLDGSGITIGVWDGGPVQITHAEFQNADNTASRVVNNEGLTTGGVPENDDHANHVTGTIAAKGVDLRAKGMAPAVSIFTYNFNDDTMEMTSVLSNPLSNMFLSNHSYGIPIEQENGNQLDPWIMGMYTNGASEIDDILRTYPNYLMVTSGGNGGQDNYTGGLFAGFDKLTSAANAKNNLVVANASPTLSPFIGGGITSLVINPSSSQGPTDDLRIKPDIAGDGTGLFSPTTSDGYSTFTGTSMSSPNVTGSLALLQQYYNQLNGNYMKAATLKGLACHTTLDDDANAGPDPLFGWGLLDAKAAAEAITGNNNGTAVISELTLNDSETYTFDFSVQSGQKLIATICWTDVRGTPLSGESNFNNATPRLVNDLDLRLSRNGTTFFPWKLDYSPTNGFSNSKADNNVDTVERIDIEVPEAGTYQLTVSHKGTLQLPGPFQVPPLTQDFSLIITGAGLTLSNNDFETSGFAIWPNPANDIINFKVKALDSSKVFLSLVDVQGRLVYSSNRNNSGQFVEGKIPTSNLQKGIYILNIKQNNSTISKKVVIQ